MEHNTIKNRILHYFNDSNKEEIYYDDIMSDLNIDLDTVVEVCDELIKEKKVEIINGA